MTYLKSKAGEIKHILEWKYDLNEFWHGVVGLDMLHQFPKTNSAWDRWVKVLGLVEVENENNINNGGLGGVF